LARLRHQKVPKLAAFWGFIIQTELEKHRRFWWLVEPYWSISAFASKHPQLSERRRVKTRRSGANQRLSSVCETHSRIGANSAPVPNQSLLHQPAPHLAVRPPPFDEPRPLC